MKNLPIFEEFQLIYALNEDAKDETRISDIIKKSEGNLDKQAKLATAMSKVIKDKDKAIRRWEAAKKILSETDPVAIIFATRANELGANIVIPTTNKKSISLTNPTFIYNEDEAHKLENKLDYDIIIKLRGYNWGHSYIAKLIKTFSVEQLIQLAIYLNKMISEKTLNVNFPKKRQAVDSLLRYVNLNKLVNKFDMGDAKTNPSNPAHFLFKDINAKEQAIADLQILKDACKEAHANYNPPASIFAPGESYTSYYQQKKGNRPIEFNDPWSMYFWNHNMIGQMSDGYWENSRKYKDDWKGWVNLLPVYNPSKKYHTFDTGPIDIQNPKLVQKYAIQGPGEEIALGKIAVLKHKDLLPFIKYGNSSREITIEDVKTLENAEKIAQNIGVDLDVYLAFLWEPGLTSTQIKRLVSDAHTGILGAMLS